MTNGLQTLEDMSTTCTRCGGSGFLNVEQAPDQELRLLDNEGPGALLVWMQQTDNHDISICDCCGDGYEWYGIRGEHYNNEDPPGLHGPYASNGGLCKCH